MRTNRTTLLPSLALLVAALVASLVPAPVALAQAKGAKKPAAPAKAPPKSSAKIDVVVDSLLDDRAANTPFDSGRFEVQLKLQGADASAVKSARARVTKAADDTGRELTAKESFKAMTEQWKEGHGADAPMPSLYLNNPARKAKTVTLEGVLEAYLPGHDANSTVKVDKVFAKKDKPLTVPALAALKVKLSVLSKQGLEAEKKAAKEAEEKKKAAAKKNKKGDDGLEQMGEALGGALTEMFERLFYMVGEHDLVLKVDDPGKKIFSFGLVGPDGKPIETYGTSEVENYRIVRIFEAPPEGTALEVRLKTDKSFAEVPFKLADVKLP